MGISEDIPFGQLEVPADRLIERICSGSLDVSNLRVLIQSGQTWDLMKSGHIWHRIRGDRIELIVTEAGEPPILIPPVLRLKIVSSGNGSRMNPTYPFARILQLLKVGYLALVIAGIMSIGVVFCVDTNKRAAIIGSIVVALSVLMLPGAAIGLAISKLVANQTKCVARWLNQILSDVTQVTNAPAPKP